MLFDWGDNNRIPPSPYKVPNLHPHNYSKIGRSQEMNEQESKAQTSQDTEKDQYPWLDLDDPRRDMTDEQILEKYIDFCLAQI